MPCGSLSAVEGDLIFFAVDHKPKRSTGLRRLRNIAENPAVAVIADQYADDWSTLWWARADGRAEIRDDGDDRRRVEPHECMRPRAMCDINVYKAVDDNVAP